MTKNTFGTTFQMSATSITGSTGKLATVTKVGFPNPSQGTTDVTNHDSANGQKEFLPSGLVEFEEISITMLVTPGDATDVANTTAVTAKALYYWQLNANGAAATYKYNGQGVPTSWKIADADLEGVYQGTLTIKPTGAITRA